jgi:peroxiredoxin
MRGSRVQTQTHRVVRSRHALAALFAAGVLAGAGACGGPSESGGATAAASATTAAAAEKPAAAKRMEPMLPRFEGRTLDGKDISSDVFRNRRGVVFSFATSEQEAEPYADLVHGLEESAAQANVAFLGLSHDIDSEAARAFAARKGFAFPLVDDRDRAIAQKLRLPAGTGIALVDGDGYIVASIGPVRPQPGMEMSEVVNSLDEQIREYLRLPTQQTKLAVDLGVRPVAAPFEVRGLDDKPLKLASFQGKPVVVMFFLHTCPHCHEMLGVLNALNKELASSDLVIIPISLQDRIYELEDMVSKFKLELAVYRDPGSTVSKAYGSGGRVPDTIVLDRQHRVVTRQLGADPRTESIVKMAIRQALGVPNPILLIKNGYAGSDACAVCHAQAHDTWSVTQHALAFDTLVKHGEEHNAECVGCHTVGFNQAGGYALDQPAPHLEGVQCESCHGRGVRTSRRSSRSRAWRRSARPATTRPTR